MSYAESFSTDAVQRNPGYLSVISFPLFSLRCIKATLTTSILGLVYQYFNHIVIKVSSSQKLEFKITIFRGLYACISPNGLLLIKKFCCYKKLDLKLYNIYRERNMNQILKIATILTLGVTSHFANATSSTETSPTGTNVVARGASSIGGIVTELKGTNGTSAVSQLAASTLFRGFNNVNPQDIGTQTGFDASIIAALGGGLSSASFRFTLFDGDTAAGDFDDGYNTLLINGFNVGN